MSRKDELIDDLTDAMAQELAPVPGEVMSLADIDRAIEDLSKQFDLLMKETGGEENIMDNVGRFKEISGQLAALKERKRRILDLRAENDIMTRQIRGAVMVMESAPAEITEWNENIIHQLVDEVKVLDKDRILVRFKGGTEVEQSLNHQEAAA